MKLQEGEKYNFFVKRVLEIGGNNYYLLLGPGEIKYLLKKDYYEHYNIDINDKIICRVDKINCRGEVFLEPEHPYYSEGSAYMFEVTGRDLRVDGKGETVAVLTLADRAGQELVVPVDLVSNYNEQLDNFIKLPVEKITKGKIVFSERDKKTGSERIEEEAVYDFYIYDRKKGLDGKDYFLVRDHLNDHHIIPAEHYSYYGLEKNCSFRGRFIKYHDTGNFKIEPVNPYYRPGQSYEFSLISESARPDGQGKILHVSDEHGLKHEVMVGNDYRAQKNMVFRVVKIRKGWPLLIP